MNRAIKIGSVSAIIIVITLITVVIGFIIPSTNKEEKTPTLSVSLSQTPNSNETLTSANITKGNTVTINVDLFLNTSRTELNIPLYLSVSAFENQPSAQVIAIPPSPYPSLPWPDHKDSPNMSKPFEASFDPNPINLKPELKTSVTLKITALDEAQYGKYALMVELGNWKKTGLGGTLFYLTVLPE